MRGLRIPMNILLAYGTPYTHLLHGEGPLEDDEIEPFFDGVHECVSRWIHYLQQQIRNPEIESYSMSVENLYDCFVELLEEDGPDVFVSSCLYCHTTSPAITIRTSTKTAFFITLPCSVQIKLHMVL